MKPLRNLKKYKAVKIQETITRLITFHSYKHDYEQSQICTKISKNLPKISKNRNYTSRACSLIDTKTNFDLRCSITKVLLRLAL